MAKGGARNRSGPPADPGSGRSDARGLEFVELPFSGFEGEAPEFPLPSPSDRELVVWAELWRSPQAVAWAREEWRWAAVGMYVRVRVRAEDPGAPGAILAQVHRFADQVGLTPAGLSENGWTIGSPAPEGVVSQAPVKRERRLRAVND